MYSVLSYLGSNPKRGDIKSFGKDLYWVPDINLRTYDGLNQCIGDAMLAYLKGMVLDARGLFTISVNDVVPLNKTPQGKCIGYMDSILAKKRNLWLKII